MEEKKEIKVRQIFHIIFAVAITATFLRMFIIDTFEVKGDSMAPTILKGDYVFVDKVFYKFKKGDNNLNRSDIIVAKARRQEIGRVIKRIIGLPGERLEIANNNVLIKKDRKDEGNILEESYLNLPMLANIASSSDFNTEATVLGYQIGLNSIQLDPKEYFVLGDNRYFSIDSREFGPIDEWDVEGRVLLIFRPSSFSIKIFK